MQFLNQIVALKMSLNAVDETITSNLITAVETINLL